MQYIKFPRGQKLRETMAKFRGQGMPCCAGAIDGCLVPILNPNKESGHYYYCYKGYYAILLLAVCDSEGYFTFIDVGQPGAFHVGRQWRGS